MVLSNEATGTDIWAEDYDGFVPNGHMVLMWKNDELPGGLDSDLP